MVIVTGADSSHARSLCQLLTSVQYNVPNCKVICYDLGMSASELRKVRELLSNMRNSELLLFDFGSYPPFFDINKNAGEYAWKPVIVASTVEKHKDAIVIWLDAGNKVHNNLKWLKRIVVREGFFSPWSLGTIGTWTHPETLKCLNVDGDFLDRRNLNAAIVSLDGQNAAARNLVKEWRDCALQKSCIAPEGSSRLNHRQDQAVLTILAYQYHFVRPARHRFIGELWEPLGIRTHCDID